ncbi:MAG: YebC/PmpR family DNA-binding transcriptional regulator [Candidatus Pacebacteria bacterium]|nr:YebC/PmpR family DNA-binding transcriptional regulator [Candidatus Paceibacterota bacterium]
MSGHSHWAGIKHKKEITDHKRGKIFSKLLALIAAAAKTEPNPAFNPRLRTAVATAHEAGVPQENIARAIKRASEAAEGLEELMFEAYGPAGAAIIIESISNNRNRAVQEVKTVLRDYNGKWAETGSVLWAFEKKDGEWEAKFPQEIADDAERAKLVELLEALEDNDDVQNVFTNIIFPS